MDEDFWRRKWRENEIGFHRPTANPMLLEHFSALGVRAGARLFLPLCGKTLDIHWLLASGYRVAGAELVETAVEQLFAELGLEPTIRPAGAVKRYAAEGIDVFAGDLFDLKCEMLGDVDAVYDRAALIALPAALRPAYAAHVTEIAGGAPQLLVSLEYDQCVVDGPPFSVTDDEVRRLYAGAYDAVLLESAEVEGGLKGKWPATETAWLLGRPV